MCEGSRHMAESAAFQVIVLGPTGGPREDRVTGMLVRSTSTQWSLNSMIAVDAGTLLAGIIRTLESNQIKPERGRFVVEDGPFAGLTLPCETAEANSAYIFREILGAVLITHPHLDHLSGLAINTPVLEAGSGPKALTALPSIVAAIKSHLFNDVIWPNLSDEDGGAGLLTYHRLVEGGNARFGRGDTRGYVRACNGLLTKCLSVSHGRCRQRYHSESGSHQQIGGAMLADPPVRSSRAISADQGESSYVHSPSRSSRNVSANPKESVWTTIESSAFFIRDQKTGSEIIVFGDVEPDSLSLDPRNRHIWEVAAPKIVNGTLRAIFIECSYNDSIDDASLYGHLCPRHLVAELSVLSKKVEEVLRSKEKKVKKRNREDSSPESAMGDISPRSTRAQSVSVGELQRGYMDSPDQVLTRKKPRLRTKRNIGRANRTAGPTEDVAAAEADNSESARVEDCSSSSSDRGIPYPLTGVSVYIIHIKDLLIDGPPPGHQILLELRVQGEAARLGCEFHLPGAAQSVWI